MIVRALAAACLVLGLAVGWFWISNQSLQAKVEIQDLKIVSLERSVASLTEAAEQSRLAAEVAKAVAEKERQTNAEFETLRDNLRNGGQDADLPCWLSNHINLVLGRLPGECSD